MFKHSFTIYVTVGVLALAGISYGVIDYNSSPSYNLIAVQRGTVIREASASGKVESPTHIDLHFKNSGRVTAKFVNTGDSVVAGQTLLRQDSRELSAQLQELNAGVDVQKAQLAQALAGASVEDIRLAETAVINALRAIKDAEAGLKKSIQDTYTKSDDAVRTKADVVFTNPRADNPQINFIINNTQLELKTESQREKIEGLLKNWSSSLKESTEDLETLVELSEENLSEVVRLLDYIAQSLNTHVAGLSETTLENWKASVSTARSNVNSVAATLSNKTEALASAQGALISAEDALAQAKAPIRKEDIELYQAQIRQAEASVARVRANLADTNLIAPVGGVITATEVNVGEIITPSVAAVSLAPSGMLQIKLNVSENNIVGVSVGQKTRITLDAFGNDTEWIGTVVAIDPAETIVGGAVYYQTTVVFDDVDERVRSGMTANVWVVIATREDVLFIPASALKKKGAVTYVEVYTSDSIEERVVETGITGKSGVIEILSGLEENEQIVT